MKIRRIIMATAYATALAMLLTACGGGASATGVPSTGNTTQTTPAATENNNTSTLSDPADGTETSAEFSITPDDTGKVTVNGNIYTLAAAGEYTVTGKLADGQIVVSAGEDDEVTVILDNASITCSFGAAILATSAGEVTVKSPDGTYNTVSETGAASADDSTDDADDTAAAIYASCDLKLSGKGILIVSSENNKGIKSKGDLTIKNVTLKVTSSGAAIKGNDSVTVESGNIIVISKLQDGIKTSNSNVSSSGNQRGILSILGGQVDIYAAGDGLSASYRVIIADGDSSPVLNIFTGAYSGYTEKSQDSAKGIKSADSIVISGGTVTIKSADDGLHANSDEVLENGTKSVGAIEITGGSVTVTSADDGMHADSTLTISGGNVSVLNSYEGLEGNVITIAGGNVYVYGKDDGINASSGATTPLISITGGTVEVVTPSGDTDAIDSNGNFTMSGGFVLIEAGSAQGSVAGSVDVDGKITVTGGTIVALGGICEVPSTGSVNTYVSGNTSFGSGSYVLSDSNGNTLASFELSNSYSSVWIASEAFELNSLYTITKDGASFLTWTQSSSIEGSYSTNPGGFGPGRRR